MTTTFPQLTVPRIFVLRDSIPEAIRRELATLAQGKIINGYRVSYIQHVGEVAPHEQGGFAAIVVVEGVEVDHE